MEAAGYGLLRVTNRWIRALDVYPKIKIEVVYFSLAHLVYGILYIKTDKIMLAANILCSNII